MVVSNIKPVKSVGSYYNYIFNDPHNDKESRNMRTFGVAGVADFEDPRDMYEMMDVERALSSNKRRKHDAYTLVLSFSDELDPNNEKDLKTAENVVNDILSEAYPNRSAVVAFQADGRGGFLHAHVLLNNVDNDGKALHENGWRHLKKHVDETSQKYGLTTLTNAKSEGSYDWREDLESKINFATSVEDLEGFGVVISGRWRKKDKTTQLTFEFEDEDGKKRKMRGRRLAAIRGYEDENVFCLEQLQERWKDQEQELSLDITDLDQMAGQVDKEYDPFAETDIRNMSEDVLNLSQQQKPPEMGL